MLTSISDALANGVSDCCSVKVVEWMCCDCKKHCEIVDIDDETIARELEIMDR